MMPHAVRQGTSRASGQQQAAESLDRLAGPATLRPRRAWTGCTTGEGLVVAHQVGVVRPIEEARPSPELVQMSGATGGHHGAAPSWSGMRCTTPPKGGVALGSIAIRPAGAPQAASHTSQQAPRHAPLPPKFRPRPALHGHDPGRRARADVRSTRTPVSAHVGLDFAVVALRIWELPCSWTGCLPGLASVGASWVAGRRPCARSVETGESGGHSPSPR